MHFAQIKQTKFKYLLLYNIIAVVVMLPVFFRTHGLSQSNFSDNLNNLSLIFGFLFLSLFISNFSSSYNIKTYFYVVAIIVITLIIYTLNNSAGYSVKRIGYKAFAINHIGLFLITFIYLISEYKRILVENLSLNAEFWFSVGVFVSSTLSLPLVFFFDDLINNNFKFLSYPFINSFPTIGYIILHISIIKSVKCLVLRLKSL